MHNPSCTACDKGIVTLINDIGSKVQFDCPDCNGIKATISNPYMDALLKIIEVQSKIS